MVKLHESTSLLLYAPLHNDLVECKKLHKITDKQNGKVTTRQPHYKIADKKPMRFTNFYRYTFSSK